MKIFRKIKENLNNFKNFKKVLVLFFDKKVSFIYKLIIIVAVSYVLFPLDFIYDFFPFLGQLDDLAILALVFDLFLKLAQKQKLQYEQKSCS